MTQSRHGFADLCTSHRLFVGGAIAPQHNGESGPNHSPAVAHGPATAERVGARESKKFPYASRIFPPIRSASPFSRNCQARMILMVRRSSTPITENPGMARNSTIPERLLISPVSSQAKLPRQIVWRVKVGSLSGPFVSFL
jgi:hypothetical protein